MDTKVKKLINCHKMYHPRADMERFHAKKKNSKRGFIQLELTNQISPIGLKKIL